MVDPQKCINNITYREEFYEPVETIEELIEINTNKNFKPNKKSSIFFKCRKSFETDSETTSSDVILERGKDKNFNSQSKFSTSYKTTSLSYGILNKNKYDINDVYNKINDKKLNNITDDEIQEENKEKDITHKLNNNDDDNNNDNNSLTSNSQHIINSKGVEKLATIYETALYGDSDQDISDINIQFTETLHNFNNNNKRYIIPHDNQSNTQSLLYMEKSKITIHDIKFAMDLEIDLNFIKGHLKSIPIRVYINIFNTYLE